MRGLMFVLAALPAIGAGGRPRCDDLCFLFWAMIISLVVIIGGFHIAAARDLGQWQASDPSLREWYELGNYVAKCLMASIIIEGR